ncbi:MAG TPA: hypothetical protein VKY31_16045 [Terriglobia bacterium]|nr:hypothetical protein [Terriglobia bacterium]
MIVPALKSTPYWELDGQKLRTTSEGQYPSQEYLRQRWFKKREDAVAKID